VEKRCLLVVPAITLTNCLNYAAGVDALVDVERNGGDFKGGMLCLASPD